jgi:Ca2+-transporting ATPase
VIAIILVTFVSAVNDYSKEKQFKKLNEKHDVKKVNVRRDGKTRSINSTELVVGDILLIEAGDILQADCVYIKGHDVKCDETSATGESKAIKKASMQDVQQARSKAEDKEKAPDCFFLSGSKVLEGQCAAVVVAVGQDSFQGRIFMELRSSQPEETRMQKALGDIAEKIAKVASIAGGLLFLALMVRFFIELKTKPGRSPAEKGQQFIQLFVISVTLIVVAWAFVRLHVHILS